MMERGYYTIIDGKTIHYGTINIFDDFVCNIANKKAYSVFVPNGMQTVWCEKNFLTDLTLPDSVDTVWCFKNDIKTFKISPSIKWLQCDLIDGIEEQYHKNLGLIIHQK